MPVCRQQLLRCGQYTAFHRGGIEYHAVFAQVWGNDLKRGAHLVLRQRQNDKIGFADGIGQA